MKEKFNITGMTCSACSSHVEKSVSEMDGVNSVSVNLLRNSMLVDFDDSTIAPDDIIATVVDSGYGASLVGEKKNLTINELDPAESELKPFKVRLAVSFIFLIPLMYVAMGHMLNFPMPSWLMGYENSITFALVQLLLTLPVVYINRNYYISGFKTLFKFAPNMDSLVAIGSGAALVYGIFAIIKIGIGLGLGDREIVASFSHDLYFESAAMILTLITVGKFLEARAKGKTTESINKLMDLTPSTAFVERGGLEMEVALEDVVIGDIVIVRPGSNVPVDGVISSGNATINEAAITGESIPIDKFVGDRVIAGTTNISGYFKVEALQVGEETTLSQIIRLVEDANMSKVPIAKLADRVSGVFVPIVITIAVIATAIWIFLGYQLDFAISIGISVLVISCPCALGLATPTAVMVGTGKGAERGILYKNVESLEYMKKINEIILDKTGTITAGELEVTDVIPINYDERELLSYAMSLERLSEHPISEAVVKYAKVFGAEEREASDLKMLPGQGIAATINDTLIAVGNIKMMRENEIGGENLIEIEGKGQTLAVQGKTPLYVSDGDRVIGIIAVADRIKESSAEAVNQLMDMGIKVSMITGDNIATAQAIAKEVGIEDVHADVMPQDKEREVRELQEAGQFVAMVGDGINDSPALARADVGIAIGAGTDIAIESADVVLMKSDLKDLVTAIELSKATLRNIKQNLFWAFIYNTIGIPLAGGVLFVSLGLKLTPMFAAAAMSLSSLFVVSNALRLKLFKSRND